MSPNLSWLIEVALRAGAVLAIAALAAFALRRGSAELRHFIWLASLIGITALPLVTASLPIWRVPILPAAQPAPPTSSASSWVEDASMLRDAQTSAPAPSRPRPTVGEIVFGVWLLGVALFAVRGLSSHRQLGSLLRLSRRLDHDELAFDLRVAAAAIGVAVPMCRWSEAIDVPLAAGSFRPVLLLPDKARGWSRDRRRAVLLHELSHLRRRDPLWLVLAQVTSALYWFHPLVWLAVRQLRTESERACDDAVLRAGERASGYAEDLLAVALEHTSPAPAAGVAFLRPGGLESRIDAILTARLDRGRLRPTQTLMVATAATLVAVALAVAQPVPATSGQKDEPTPAPEAAFSEAPSREAWLSRAARTAPSFVGYKNALDAPVLILEANARFVDLEGGRAGITMPAMRLANRDRSRRVRELRLGLDLPTTRDRITETVNIAAGEEAQLRVLSRKWSSVVAAEEAKRLELGIVGVQFADGSTWAVEEPEPRLPPGTKTAGKTPKSSQPIAPRPTSEQSARAAADGPTLAALFRNPAGAPVVIVEALTPLTPGIDEGRAYTWLPRVRIENRSAKRVVGLRVRYKPDRESHAVSGFDVTIEPHSAATLTKDAFPVWGRAEDMKVQLLGVEFADGSIWGTMDSSIDARDTWVYPLEGSDAR